MKTLFIGIDPGKSGGIAYIDTENDISGTMPYGDTALIDLCRDIRSASKAVCCLEKVGAMPGQGVVSMFTFGTGYGWLQGVLAAYGIPYELVRPQQWKKEFGITADKNSSIDVCKRLFPAVRLRANDRCRTDHDGMAEALLMAEYAKRKLVRVDA